jgi:hypothetical protein
MLSKTYVTRRCLRECCARCYRGHLLLQCDVVKDVLSDILRVFTPCMESVHAHLLQCDTITGTFCSVSMAHYEEAGSDVESVGESVGDSHLESVGECDHPFQPYPFEEYEQQLRTYLQRLALLHSQHMYFFERGLLNTQNFLPETMEDVYNNNLYAMSWFYEGCYPFDTWEDNYDHWLYDQVFF